MTKIYLYGGPRDGDVESIKGDEANIRLGIVWNFRRPAYDGAPLSESMVDQYRINKGPDDDGHYGARYLTTLED